jgi:2-iminobutanoate/2-iminopropanoate deaminase
MFNTLTHPCVSKQKAYQETWSTTQLPLIDQKRHLPRQCCATHAGPACLLFKGFITVTRELQMSHYAIAVNNAPAASGNYSQAIDAGGLVFVAGNGPYDPETREVVGETIEEQTNRTMRNIEAILRGVGLDWSHVVNTTVYLEQLLRDWAGFDRIYGTFLTPPYPARATTGAALKNILVEISVVAVMPS